jgi:hypothetical protein
MKIHLAFVLIENLQSFLCRLTIAYLLAKPRGQDTAGLSNR